MAGAPFCPHCGAALDGSAAEPVKRNPLAYVIPAAVAVILLVVVAMQSAKDEGPAPTGPMGGPMGGAAPPFAGATGGPMGGGGPGGVDIASMTPQERASRLFDRVMRYAAEGKQDSVMIFAPMALQSFEMLGELDAHGHYDRGLVAVVAGNYDGATADAKAILDDNKNHLLGLALGFRIAAAKNDQQGQNLYRQRFLGSLDAEKAKGLQEYQDHSNDIEAMAKELRGK